MVPIKPYAALIHPIGQTVGPDGVWQNPTQAAVPQAIQCYFERITPAEAYERFGVELSDPAFIQCELFDGAKFTPDAEVQVDNRVYRVVGEPEHHSAGNDADHTDVVLESRQYPIL